MKHAQLALLIILLLVLAGCDYLPGKKDHLIDPAKFHEGTSALSMSAAARAPPSIVKENSEFKFYAILKNLGVAPIENGLIKLVVLDKDHIEGRPPLYYSNINLKGRSLEWPDGETDMRYFSLTAKEVKNEMSSAQTELMLVACYDYYTELLTDVCIDTDIYGVNSQSAQKACSYNSARLGSKGQGGPVEFVRLESDFISTETGVIPEFKLYLSNMGKGGVYKAGEHMKICGSEPIEDGKLINNLVSVEAWLSNQQMDCTVPGGKTELDISNPENYVVCKASSEVPKSTIAYSSPLKVIARYGYTNSFSKPVLIEAT